MKPTTLQLKPHNEGRPTDPRIVINPEKWGYNKDGTLDPQACEHNGNWYYNFPAIQLLEGIPTRDELLKIINSIPGNCIEKAKALNIPFAGYRCAVVGEFDDEGDIGGLWSSSPGGDGDARCVYLRRVDVVADGSWGDRGHGFPARSFLDKSVSSTPFPLEEITINGKVYTLTPKN